jgi:hypothetical protein
MATPRFLKNNKNIQWDQGGKSPKINLRMRHPAGSRDALVLGFFLTGVGKFPSIEILK